MTSNKPELSSVENLMTETVWTQMRHEAFRGLLCTNVSILSFKAVCRKKRSVLTLFRGQQPRCEHSPGPSAEITPGGNITPTQYGFFVCFFLRLWKSITLPLKFSPPQQTQWWHSQAFPLVRACLLVNVASLTDTTSPFASLWGSPSPW